MSDNDAPDERRTEGVRIIGAQEAAEAAGRPDVVRRRRRSEKRYGDRPDAPEPASDLPKITISTTEGDGSDRYGEDRYAGQVIQPEPGDQEPSWSDSGGGAYDDSERAGFGHARIVGAEEPAASSGDDASWSDTGTLGAPEWDDPYEPPSWGREDDAAHEPFGTTPAADATAYEPAPAASGVAPADDGTGLGAPFLDDGPDDAPIDDDSFVLPHWTEPPTGQVPKVVVGEGAPEPESLASYGSQPRWRDEGERTSVTDFDDLVDDGPALGALGNDAVEDDFFSSERFADDRFIDEFADDGVDDGRGRRPDRPRRRGRRAAPTGTASTA